MNKTIIVVTHCQTYGLANALSFLLPDYDVIGEDQNIFENKLKSGEALELRRCEIFVRGPQLANVSENSAYDGRLLFKRDVIVPGLQIDRYHPDICWIPHAGKMLWGPIGQNHSRIVFRAYQKGYTASEIADLFNRDTYEKAGYLRYRPGQLNNLIGRFAKFDLDISKYIAKWSRHGSFMHTINHPKIECLFDIACEIVRNLGLPSMLDDDPEIRCSIEDNLAIGAVYPVYPEIAEAYGFRGHYYFKKPHSYRMLGLRDFIEQSLVCYEAAHKEEPLGDVSFYTPHYSDDRLAKII